MTPLPDWLAEVAQVSAQMQVSELTRFGVPDDFDGREGAVLVLFRGDSRAEGTVLLTERSHTMRSHPGQVSFPGGGLDEGEDARQAALREAREETGADPDGIRIFGELPRLYMPPSNYAVTPVLAWWERPSPVSVVDPAEVHQIYEVPIEELLDPQYRCNVQSPRLPGYKLPSFLIGPDHDLILWGFTAGVLSRLFDRLGWTVDWDPEVVRDLPERMLESYNTTRRRIAEQGGGR